MFIASRSDESRESRMRRQNRPALCRAVLAFFISIHLNAYPSCGRDQNMNQRDTQFAVTEVFRSVDAESRKEMLQSIVDAFLKIKLAT